MAGYGGYHGGGYQNQAGSSRVVSAYRNPRPVQCESGMLSFDGASRGNPGQCGAGAVLRADDGSIVVQMREGVGYATNNVAEYRALILGLNQALARGYKHIHVQGDSKLICNQVQGFWRIKNPYLADLCEEVHELMERFVSFEINHVPREYNSEADEQANRAVNLQDGVVEVNLVY